MPVRVSYIEGLLEKSTSGYGFYLLVGSDFKKENFRGGFNSSVEERAATYVLLPEGRKNWITFKSKNAVVGFTDISKRFVAADVLACMRAIRGDIMKMVLELQQENTLIRGEIANLVNEITAFFHVPARNE